ncbi:hypothetical protein RhiirA5_378434 [Rhizophagus irregularis]|uniref:Uncharacterized protein n=1 Tax=Rhizophagus irregularis TaxID=588596 RepID=A0A2N0PFS7_9GLOM|nr:hypothetical protein RhiirA5_378434 [Rhizophagus irregularis]
MLLLESSVEIAHKIYVDNMKRLGKDNEKLRGWLSEANTQSRESNRIIVKQVKNKESHSTLNKASKKRVGGQTGKIKKSDHIGERKKKNRRSRRFPFWLMIRIHLLYKVLKTISKNWKLLMYLKNKNIMKTVIKNGLERGMVWSFRRFKEPIRSKQEEKSKTESEQESLDTPYQENDLETLPQKNFLELGGISKYQMTKKKLGSSNDVEQLTSVSEEKVVDTINQFRKRLEVNEEKTVTGSQLKKDNATTDEVVNIINEQREEKKLLVP